MVFDPCGNNYATWDHTVAASLAFLQAMACFKTLIYLPGIHQNWFRPEA